MTLPLPANLDGPVPPMGRALEQRQRATADRVEELARKDLSNGNVSQGSKLRVLHNNGNQAVIMGTDPVTKENRTQIHYETGQVGLSMKPGAAIYGGKHQLGLFDTSGKAMFATDEVAGFGVSAPGYTYGFWGWDNFSAGMPTSLATATTIAEGTNFVYTPTWFVNTRVQANNGATSFTLNLFYQQLSGDGVSANSGVVSQVIGANSINIINVPKVLQLRAIDMNKSTKMQLKAYVTGSDATLTHLQAFPLQSSGTSQALWDLNPSFH